MSQSSIVTCEQCYEDIDLNEDDYIQVEDGVYIHAECMDEYEENRLAEEEGILPSSEVLVCKKTGELADFAAEYYTGAYGETFNEYYNLGTEFDLFRDFVDKMDFIKLGICVLDVTGLRDKLNKIKSVPHRNISVDDLLMFNLSVHKITKYMFNTLDTEEVSQLIEELTYMFCLHVWSKVIVTYTANPREPFIVVASKYGRDLSEEECNNCLLQHA